MATWEINHDGETHRTIFLSDGAFVTDTQSQADESHSRFWGVPVDDKVVIEFPDPSEATATLAQAFDLSPDGTSLTGHTKDGDARVWKHVED